MKTLRSHRTEPVRVGSKKLDNVKIEGVGVKSFVKRFWGSNEERT